MQSDEVELRQLAAGVVQRCFRSFQLRRLYKFYRDLIREREKGDAATLLRMVNPQVRFARATSEEPHACTSLLVNRIAFVCVSEVSVRPRPSCRKLGWPRTRRLGRTSVCALGVYSFPLLSITRSSRTGRLLTWELLLHATTS